SRAPRHPRPMTSRPAPPTASTTRAPASRAAECAPRVTVRELPWGPSYGSPGSAEPRTREDQARGNVDRQNEHQQDKSGRECLTMPVGIRRRGVLEDHGGKRCRRLIEAGTPELVADAREQERRGFAGHTGKIEHDAGNDALL